MRARHLALNSEAWIVCLAAPDLLTILMTMVAKVVIVKSGQPGAGDVQGCCFPQSGMARTPHMHETSVAQRMVDTAIEVADQNGGGQVVGMRLLLGEMTCVEPETLSFAFGVVSRGTRAQGCQLEIVRVPTRLRCRTCGIERGGDLLEPCVCGMPGGEVLAGRELRLDTIDIDEEAALAAGK